MTRSTRWTERIGSVAVDKCIVHSLCPRGCTETEARRACHVPGSVAGPDPPGVSRCSCCAVDGICGQWTGWRGDRQTSVDLRATCRHISANRHGHAAYLCPVEFAVLHVYYTRQSKMCTNILVLRGKLSPVSDDTFLFAVELRTIKCSTMLK